MRIYLLTLNHLKSSFMNQLPQSHLLSTHIRLGYNIAHFLSHCHCCSGQCCHEEITHSNNSTCIECCRMPQLTTPLTEYLTPCGHNVSPPLLTGEWLLVLHLALSPHAVCHHPLMNTQTVNIKLVELVV